MKSFEEHLQTIHKKISLKDEDRKPYTEMFDNIKNWLLAEMCEVDPVFKRLYKGTCLFGSYSNQVRIIKPSEFDVFILLEFPFQITPLLYENNPGFLRLLIKDFVKNNQNYYDVYNLVQRRRKSYYLKRESLQTWINEIIKKVLKTRSMPYGYYIGYTKCSVALNIYVYEQSDPYKTISVDFVPAFKIGDHVEVSSSRLQLNQLRNFFAIPKSIPNKGMLRSCSFQLVNPTAERELLWDKQNLKVVYRLLKSLRDHYGLDRLKSYFLTAIFLLEVQTQNDEFWKNSIGYLFIHMLGKLSNYFDNRKLPYIWFPNFNLLRILSATEVAEYAKILHSVWETLKTYPDQNKLSYLQIARHFKISSD